MVKRTSILTIAIALIATFGLPRAGFAQATGTGGAGGAPTTGLTPVPPRGGEIDLPIGEPVANVEQADPQPPVEDDPKHPKIYDEDLPTKTDSLYYVIDISGSMSWDDHTYTGADGQQRTGPRIDRAKAELVKSITALPEDFEFNVFAYDCDLRQWSAQRQKADPGPKASAIGWTNNLQPDGATGTGPAVAGALGDKSNFTIVLLTDGAPNCPFDDSWDPIPPTLQMIQQANTQKAVIHVFGIAAYGDYEQFCRDVASTSGGQYYSVP